MYFSALKYFENETRKRRVLWTGWKTIVDSRYSLKKNAISTLEILTPISEYCYFFSYDFAQPPCVARCAASIVSAARFVTPLNV